MSILGIDPGAKGAAFLITQDRNLAILRFLDKAESEIAEDLRWFKYSNPRAFLEDVHAMPGDGRQSAFTFGSNFGFIRGVLICHRIPFEKIDAKRWQYEFALGGKQGPPGCSDSEESAARKRNHKKAAQALFPTFNVTLDMADAMLIAEYGWRKTYGVLTHGKKHFENGLRPGTGVVRTVTRIR